MQGQMLYQLIFHARSLGIAGLGSAGESDSGSAEVQSKKRGAKPKYKFSTEAEAVAMRCALISHAKRQT